MKQLFFLKFSLFCPNPILTPMYDKQIHNFQIFI